MAIGRRARRGAAGARALWSLCLRFLPPDDESESDESLLLGIALAQRTVSANSGCEVAVGDGVNRLPRRE